jgi:hypothetical protein
MWSKIRGVCCLVYDTAVTGNAVMGTDSGSGFGEKTATNDGLQA